MIESVLHYCGAGRNAPKKNTAEDAALHASIKQTIQRLREDPDDEHLQQKAANAFAEHLEVVFDVLKEEVYVPVSPVPNQPTLIPSVDDSDENWFNCIGEQRCTPDKKSKPTSLEHLVQIMKEACDQGLRVRAVGSGYSFSDVARTDRGMLVDPILLKRVSEVDLGTLRAGRRSEMLVNVQAGITLRSLAMELDNRGLALINMGGCDVETIAGAFATGTHGSGISFGPLSSFARSIVLVTDEASVYQIEKSDGITDPGKFSGEIDGIRVTLKQNDKWFDAISTSMGCMGIVYSYIIAVTPAYSIREVRSSTTWNDIKTSLMPDLWNPVPPSLAKNDHFELFLNPYNRWSRNACVKVERKRLPGKVRQKGEKHDWFEALLQRLSIQSPPELVNFLNSIPFLSPLLIDAAMTTRVSKKPYVDKSFNVFNLGSANEIKALALELHCDAKQTVPAIDKLLDVLRDKVSETKWFLAGPITIRWVAASDAFMAPQAGRMTCAIELTMLVRDKTGQDIARHVKGRMCGKSVRVYWGQDPPVRVHWGLDLDLVTRDDVEQWYPDFPCWFDVCFEMNRFGRFNNKFMDRIGISMTDPTC